MGTEANYHFNKSANAMKATGLQGSSEAKMSYDMCRRQMRLEHIRTKPRLTAVNATGGFNITRKGGNNA